MTSEDVWRGKSDLEVFEASTHLDDYTEEGQRVIRAEFARRGVDPARMEAERETLEDETPPLWQSLLAVLVLYLVGWVWYQAHQAGDPKVHGASSEISARACDHGNAESCADLADVFMNGTDLPRNWPAASEVYQQSCTLGSARGCNSLGLMNEYGSAIPTDMAHARSLYKKACDGGDGHGCANLKRIGGQN